MRGWRCVWDETYLLLNKLASVDYSSEYSTVRWRWNSFLARTIMKARNHTPTYSHTHNVAETFPRWLHIQDTDLVIRMQWPLGDIRVCLKKKVLRKCKLNPLTSCKVRPSTQYSVDMRTCNKVLSHKSASYQTHCWWRGEVAVKTLANWIFTQVKHYWFQIFLFNIFRDNEYTLLYQIAEA